MAKMTLLKVFVHHLLNLQAEDLLVSAMSFEKGEREHVNLW